MWRRMWISDPGFLLVRTCVEQGIEVQTLPGPTAFVPALVTSGLPCDRFVFEGFLPPKKGRQTRLDALAAEWRTMVFYESPHRLLKTLQQFEEVFCFIFGNRDMRRNKMQEERMHERFPQSKLGIPHIEQIWYQAESWQTFRPDQKEGRKEE